MPRSARLFVISGPSGAGKGTLVARVREQLPDLGLTVSATTRPPRPGEIDGVSYHFLTDEEFTRRVDSGEFLEWAHVHDHRYGTLKTEVDSRLQCGQSIILELDVQGALAVRTTYPDAVLVFIEPPSLEILETRLRGRATEDEHELRIRLDNARNELQYASSYDERIVNDDLERAVQDLLGVIERHENK